MSAQNQSRVRRSRRRWVVLLILLGGLALFVGRHVYLERIVDGELARLRAAGEPTTPAELNASSTVPAEAIIATDAWRDVLDALRTYWSSDAWRESGIDLIELRGVFPEPGDDWPELELAEKFLTDHAQVIKQAERAASLGTRCSFVDDHTDGYQTLLPHVQGLRGYSHLMLLRAFVDAHRGDAEATLADLQLLLDGSATLATEPVLVSQLHRGLVNHSDMLVGLEYLLPVVRFNDEQLSTLQHDIANIDYREGLIRAVEGERVMGLIAFQDPATADAGRTPSIVCRAWIRDHPAHFLRVMRELTSAVKCDWPERLRRTAHVEAGLWQGSGVKSPFGVGGNEWVRPSSAKAPVRKVIEVLAVATARARAAEAGIALLRAHQAGETEISRLEDLVPEWLPAVPADPFTGEALRLRRDRSEAVIYAVGLDGQDDRGREDVRRHEEGHQHREGRPDVVFRLRLPNAP